MPIQPTNERSRKFRAACMVHNLTMAQVAEALGITESHLSRAVSGQRTMMPAHRRMIRNMLNLPMTLWDVQP